jgi:hypothetical protein
MAEVVDIILETVVKVGDVATDENIGDAVAVYDCAMDLTLDKLDDADNSSGNVPDAVAEGELESLHGEQATPYAKAVMVTRSFIVTKYTERSRRRKLLKTIEEKSRTS